MGELNNVELEVVHISAEQTHMVCERAKQCGLRNGSCLSSAVYMVCGRLNNKHLEVVPISAEQAYIVCERAKQCGLRNGSYLSRANIPGLRES